MRLACDNIGAETAEKLIKEGFYPSDLNKLFEKGIGPDDFADFGIKNADDADKVVKYLEDGKSTDEVKELMKGIPDLSNKALKHPMNDHMPYRYAKQLKYMDRTNAEKYLSYKTFFNPKWTDEQVRSALNYGYKEALTKGMSTVNYIFTYLGEEVTVCIEDGIFKTGYGNYKFTYDELLKLLTH